MSHGEVPAYNNAKLLYCQARFGELDGTVIRPTPIPSGHLGGGRYSARNRHAFVVCLFGHPCLPVLRRALRFLSLAVAFSVFYSCLPAANPILYCSSQCPLLLFMPEHMTCTGVYAFLFFTFD
jgi:hypothetical protein